MLSVGALQKFQGVLHYFASRPPRYSAWSPTSAWMLRNLTQSSIVHLLDPGKERREKGNKYAITSGSKGEMGREGGGGQRDNKETKSQTEKEIDKERDKDTQTERDRERERQREKERDRKRQRDRDKKRQRERERQRQRKMRETLRKRWRREVKEGEVKKERNCVYVCVQQLPTSISSPGTKT